MLNTPKLSIDYHLMLLYRYTCATNHIAFVSQRIANFVYVEVLVEAIGQNRDVLRFQQPNYGIGNGRRARVPGGKRLL